MTKTNNIMTQSTKKTNQESTIEENDVYVTEDRPLARALYDAVEVGEEIPEEFYKAIAKILAFVYNLKEKNKKTSKK